MMIAYDDQNCGAHAHSSLRYVWVTKSWCVIVISAELCARQGDQTEVQLKGHTEVGMRLICRLLHRTLHRCWQSHQLCGVGCAHVRGELIDRQQARPA